MNNTIWHFALMFGSLTAFTIGALFVLDCIWRVEKRIRNSLEMVIVAFVLTISRIIFNLVGNYSRTLLQISDILSGILLMVAVYTLYKVLRSIDNEDKA